MTELAHLLVSSNNPTQTAIHPCTNSEEPLGDGQILVHVAKLVVTANSVTYAIAGKVPILKYFQHFPIPSDAPKSLAMAPCWGTGVVRSSKCPDIKAGTRIHGYMPYSPTVVLTPSNVRATSFMDAAAHRAGLLQPYLTYYTNQDPQYQGLSYDMEDYQLGTGVLFTTGWSMAQVAAVHSAKPAALILTSASSRTSRAAAFAAKFHKLPLQIIGLTSTSNVDYVRGLGLYDAVCPYDSVKTLKKQKVAMHDVAGSAAVKQALYEHFGDDIVYCGSVGLAHSGTAGQRPKLEGLGGSPPSPFLVFAAMKELEKVYGNELQKMEREASKAYNAKYSQEFKAVRKFGAKETQEVFDSMVQGKAKPDITYVCSMWPKDLHDPVVPSSKL